MIASRRGDLDIRMEQHAVIRSPAHRTHGDGAHRLSKVIRNAASNVALFFRHGGGGSSLRQFDSLFSNV